MYDPGQSFLKKTENFRNPNLVTNRVAPKANWPNVPCRERTPPNFNIAPENQRLEEDPFLSGPGQFSVANC